MWVKVLRGNRWTGLLGGSNSRWWLKEEDPKLTSSHGHSKSTAPYGTISDENLKMTSTHWAYEQNYSSAGRRGWDTINPILSAVTFNQEGTQNLDLLLEEWRAWASHQVPQFLRSAPERWAPKTSSFQNQWGWHPEIHKAIANWEMAFIIINNQKYKTFFFLNTPKGKTETSIEFMSENTWDCLVELPHNKNQIHQTEDICSPLWY